MRKKIVAALLSLAVLVTGIPDLQMVSANTPTGSNGQIELQAETVETTGKTYYVSTLDGNDNNDGLSENKAFYSLQKINEITLQPGDRVLLEAGSVFTNGYLHIDGSGSEEAPIIIDRYGDESAPDPRIDTNGQGVWYQDYGKQLDSASHKYEGYVSSSILLFDVEYIEIRNLEITNEAPNIEPVYNYLHVMNRTGVAAVAQNIGTVDHIVLDGLNVHNVIGNVYDKHMNNGGIYFTVFKPLDEEETGISRYNDVVIKNCIVKDVNRWGIAVGYSAYHDKFGPALIPDDVIAKYGSGEVVIENNYLEEIGGDAITLMYCDRPLIQYNVSKGAAKQINGTDYSQTGSGRVAAGIWPWKCKTAIFQYNECYDMYANQDGQAWDADSGDGTIYQYNYSHNNGGGCIMFCAGQAINNIFRYNISYKEAASPMNNAGNPDAHVYNNTFYITEGQDFIRTNMTGGPMKLENNIFYYMGSTPKANEPWYKGDDAKTKYVYNNNLYYNYANTPEGDENAIVGDPKFVEAEEAPTAYSGRSALDEEVITYDPNSGVYDMFQLQAGSPAINAGVRIEGNGGKDFYGNPVVGVPDIGAYDSQTPSAKVASTLYPINQNEMTITLSENDKVTVQQFMDSLEQEREGSVTVVVKRNGMEIRGGIRLNEGDQVVSSFDGETVTYTVHVESSNTGDEIPLNRLTAEVGSFEPNNASEGDGSLAIDDNLSTIWHTKYTGGTATLQERYIQLAVDNSNLEGHYELTGFKYMPRQGTSSNGLINGYEIYTKADDSSQWVKQKEGTWTYDNRNYKVVTFDAPVNAKYVKLQATSTQGDWATAAEVRVLGNFVSNDQTPPATPVLTKGDVTLNTVAFSWTGSEDTAEYELYAGEEKIASFDATVNAYTVSGLLPGTTYEFILYAYDEAGNSSEGSIVEVTTANDPEVKEVVDLIAAIGEVTLESEEAIQAARAAYDALPEEKKALVGNYAVLTDAEAALEEKKEEAGQGGSEEDNQATVDKEAADAVIKQIAAIGTVTLNSETAITQAKAAYDKLTDAQKALVTNYKVLTDAETVLVQKKKEAADKAAADKAAADKAAAEKAAAEKAAADKAAADAVINQINALGTITVDSEEALKKVISMYNSLTTEQKALVKNFSIVTSAQATLEQLKGEQTKPGNDTENPVVDTVKTGETFEAGGNNYKVKNATEVILVGAVNKNTKKVTIPATVNYKNTTLKVTSIGNKAFKGYKALTNVKVGVNVKSIGTSAFEGCLKLKKVTLGNGLTTINNKAFKGCKVLKNITIPVKVTTIGKEAFRDCVKLNKITIKATKLKSVKKNAFKNISAKAKMKVPKKQMAAYKKLLKNKGQGKKVTITK